MMSSASTSDRLSATIVDFKSYKVLRSDSCFRRYPSTSSFGMCLAASTIFFIFFNAIWFLTAMIGASITARINPSSIQPIKNIIISLYC